MKDAAAAWQTDVAKVRNFALENEIQPTFKEVEPTAGNLLSRRVLITPRTNLITKVNRLLVGESLSLARVLTGSEPTMGTTIWSHNCCST